MHTRVTEAGRRAVSSRVAALVSRVWRLDARTEEEELKKKRETTRRLVLAKRDTPSLKYDFSVLRLELFPSEIW